MSDPEGRSPERAIKMHEFLMTGGIKVGEREGRITYGDPIDHHDPAYATTCPWHGSDPVCEAWLEIVAGRGCWTKMQDELDVLMKEAVADKTADPARGKRAEELAVKLSLRPRDAKALRERTPEMIAEEKAHHDRNKAKARQDFARAAATAQATAESLGHGKVPVPVSETSEPSPRVYAKAGPKTGGNPWDRVDSSAGTTTSYSHKGTALSHVNTSTGEVSDSWWNDAVEETQHNELADGVAAAFGGEEVPDEIIIEGNEEDED